MFASRSFGALQRPNSLDMPVAALAGLAVAFIAFAAPADLLANLVSASGLPSILPAAEPPLGLKARFGLGAGGALVAFGIAMLVLRWLGRFGARRAEEAEAVTELEVPRLRRRDIHPDAPARPPLLAVHELGEPELELTQIEPEPEPEPEPIAAPQPQPQPQPQSQSQPPLLARKPDRQAEPYAPASFEPEPTSYAAPAAVDIPPTPPADEAQNDQARAYALSQRNWADFEPEPENGADHPWLAEPAFEAEPKWGAPSAPSLPEPEAAEAAEPAQVESPQSHWQPKPTPEAEPAFETEPGWETSSAPPWTPKAAEPVEPVEAESGQSELGAEPAPEAGPVFETEPEWETPSSSTPWAAEPEAVEPEQPEGRQSVWTAEPAPEAEPEWEQAAAPIEPEWEQAASPVEPWPAPRAVSIEPEPPLPEPEPQAEQVPAPEIVEAALPAPATGSIAELMERLEKGLARHRPAPTASPAPTPVAPPAPVRPISPDAADDRLQNAIESLQRFASRQD